MSNMRIITDNAADRASVSASNTAGSLVAGNLIIDERAAIWRSTSNTATLTLTWAAPEIIDSVCLAWTNLTSVASVTVKGYALPGDSVPVVTAAVVPDDGLPLGEFVFGVDPLVQSGAARAAVASQAQAWFAAAPLRKVEIVISDPTNTDGYVQASRVVAGVRYEIAYNPSYGMEVSWNTDTKPQRAESRDLRVEPAGAWRTLKLSLDYMPAADRNAVLNLMANGLGRGVWICVLPDAADTSDRQIYAFWAALTQGPGVSRRYYAASTTTIVFEEMA